MSGLGGMFKSVAALLALLAPFTDHPVHDAVDALTRLEDVEVKCQGKARAIKDHTSKGEK